MHVTPTDQFAITLSRKGRGKKREKRNLTRTNTFEAIRTFFLGLLVYFSFSTWPRVQARIRQAICIKLIEPETGFSFYKTMHLQRFLAAARPRLQTCKCCSSIRRRALRPFPSKRQTHVADYEPAGINVRHGGAPVINSGRSFVLFFSLGATSAARHGLVNRLAQQERDKREKLRYSRFEISAAA